MKYAVCAVIEKDGQLLVISRRDNIENWNLPGGKVEDGEGFIPAVIRETFEETGLTITNPVTIFQGMCSGETDYYTLAFYAKDFSGELISSDEGIVRWGTWEDILSPLCSFKDYNRRLYDAYLSWQKNTAH